MTFSFCLFLVYGKVYDINVKNNKILNVIEKQFNEKYYTVNELEYANVPRTSLHLLNIYIYQIY